MPDCSISPLTLPLPVVHQHFDLCIVFFRLGVGPTSGPPAKPRAQIAHVTTAYLPLNHFLCRLSSARLHNVTAFIRAVLLFTKTSACATVYVPELLPEESNAGTLLKGFSHRCCYAVTQHDAHEALLMKRRMNVLTRVAQNELS